jgi:predicted Zn-dependent protease
MSYGYEYGGPDEHRGPNLRWVAGLIIAVIGFFIYMAHTEVNPVTGQRQHVAMDVEQERSLGLQAAPSMAAKMGGAIDPRSDRRAEIVSVIGRRIVARSDARNSPYFDNFHFYLLDDPRTINAFALPGGQVFVTLGLYNKLENEAQLAGVIGHEIGHVIMRHSAQQLAKGRLGQMLTVAVGVGASDRNDGGRSAQMAAALANQVTQLHFSRDDESEADAVGLRYMAETGYNPYAMLDVMQVLLDASKGSNTPEFLQTHPLPESRLREIKQSLDKTYHDGVPSDLTSGRSLPH